VADVIVPLGGWGSQAWGQAGWGEGSTSLVATGQVGSVTISIGAVVNVTGVSGTGNIGSVTVQAGANIPVTGLQATGSVGSVLVSAGANVSVTGVFGTGQVGAVAVEAVQHLGVALVGKTVCLETAHPAKFADIVQKVLPIAVEKSEALKQIEKRVGKAISMPNDYQVFKDFLVGL
jgi:hypothetical protein